MTDQSHAERVPHFVITMSGEIHGENSPANMEIVRRIHACVDACAGISTADLEAGIVGDMQRVIAQVVPLLKGSEGRRAAG